MSEIKELEQIKSFVAKLSENTIQSTGATVVNYSSNLYNVKGSTNDPAKVPGHLGESWKDLLKSYGIDHDCYVTNSPAPGSSSHPNFSVGGHMTQNSNGSVSGGTCYLMPLCYWHNSTSRDGVSFTHTETKMLKLTGYMQGELGVTFALRMPSNDRFAVLYHQDNEWKFKNLADNQAKILNEDASSIFAKEESVEHYVVIERKQAENTIHEVVSSKLP